VKRLLERGMVCVIVADTLFGFWASMFLDYYSLWEAINIAVFVAAFPVFLLFRLRVSKASVALMWLLFLTRWMVECFDSKHFQVVSPIAWVNNLLLTGAALGTIALCIPQTTTHSN